MTVSDAERLMALRAKGDDKWSSSTNVKRFLFAAYDSLILFELVGIDDAQMGQNDTTMAKNMLKSII